MTSSIGGYGMGVPGKDQFMLTELTLGVMLGDGGQGTVYRLTSHPGFVFKRYKGVVPDARAFQELIEFPGTLNPQDRRFILDRTAWPLHRVLDGPRIAGFVMREAPVEYRGTTAAGSKLRELHYLLYKNKSTASWGDIVPLDMPSRLELVRDFAELVRLLHANEVALGDISMSNTLWSATSPQRAFQMDCDSMTLAQGLPVAKVPFTQDWDDPVQPGQANRDSDLYKLALFVGRVLCGSAYKTPLGTRLEENVPIGELDFLPGLDARIADAVRARFNEAGGDLADRPDAGLWLRALSGRGSTPLIPPPPRPSELFELPSIPAGRAMGPVISQPFRRP